MVHVKIEKIFLSFFEELAVARAIKMACSTYQ